MILGVLALFSWFVVLGGKLRLSPLQVPTGESCRRLEQYRPVRLDAPDHLPITPFPLGLLVPDTGLP